MSRVPVREALIELAQESLIDAVPRRGHSSADWNRRTSSITTGSSGSSPGSAGSRAATSLTDEQLAELRRIHESFVAATDPEDKEQWNHEFHRIVNQRRRLASVGLCAPALVAQLARYGTSSSSRSGPTSGAATTPAS